LAISSGLFPLASQAKPSGPKAILADACVATAPTPALAQGTMLRKLGTYIYLAALTVLGVGRLVHYWVRTHAVTVTWVPIALWDFGYDPYFDQGYSPHATRREVWGGYLDLGPLEIRWFNLWRRERLGVSIAPQD
jgi:hypothetical protein